MSAEQKFPDRLFIQTEKKRRLDPNFDRFIEHYEYVGVKYLLGKLETFTGLPLKNIVVDRSGQIRTDEVQQAMRQLREDMLTAFELIIKESSKDEG